MALEETLRAVLAQTGTAPAALTRGFLAGLRTALDGLPGPGTADLAADLDAVLAAPAPEQPVAAVTAASPLRESLLGLAERIAPGSTAPSHDEGTLWTAVHLNALRLSRREADLVRRAAEEVAVRSGARPGKPGAAVTLHGPKDERLIPALKVDGRVVAPGLAVSGGGAPKTAGSVPAEMATFAAMIPVLAELDPGLHHCLQTLEFSGLRGLAEPAARTGYVGHLNNRLEEVASQRRHSGPWLESVVRLHEALCSVVHLPPAPEDSWWGEWRAACNDALSDAALDSGAGTVKFPPGRYRSADDLTRHDIAIHYPERPGQVLACVRAWSSVHGIETPGRVIYAS
ncbi:hypothetical protein [Herbidospora yilanensis]|uniref:hypothetical protein n=1 Tax=Herbidospora yilanensis TaxID=354426 RepID=UPI000780CCD7|nr:hypothetical protein [Herbidospora yilanensis]